MRCKSCGSDNQSEFTAEMAVHFPGLKNINKPIVWVFPLIWLCLDCGVGEFVVPLTELRALAKDNAAPAAR